MKDQTTRDHIIEAADRLFYQQGFEHTSFSHIAGAVQISRGNFYYHFKTKDEILEAVINKRLADRRMMLGQWEIDGDTPVDRIQSFINILLVNKDKIQLYGCPIGTLSTELAKLNHGAQEQANQLFTLFRSWLGRQFSLLGRDRDADVLAMHVLAHSQGVATLANAFNDEAFIRQEVRQISDWLAEIAGHCPKEQGQQQLSKKEQEK
ncbi:TetR/AcrR family transcriptional regulator [Kiloniella laminariae]|uniref:TetR/AcrR family transcriptional regulator n=1 Tax=Kiloniella laminariae TaxID=454162 RepID=A0ABT4LFI0_9PROT|nr:TetR/AcrR family transcriptional regulator [Kiloniella laminariae]MCZ4279860.1 TetR/AcrR family transcriptional regulator [Kiloniella laminariae]